MNLPIWIYPHRHTDSKTDKDGHTHAQTHTHTHAQTQFCDSNNLVKIHFYLVCEIILLFSAKTKHIEQNTHDAPTNLSKHF